MKRYLSILVVLLTLTSSAIAGDPVAPADKPQASVIPTLTDADRSDIANFLAHQEDANKAAELARLKQEKTQAVLAAANYRILARHKLDPDRYVIDLVTRKDQSGNDMREWAIVEIQRQPAAPPPAPKP